MEEFDLEGRLGRYSYERSSFYTDDLTHREHPANAQLGDLLEAILDHDSELLHHALDHPLDESGSDIVNLGVKLY